MRATLNQFFKLQWFKMNSRRITLSISDLLFEMLRKDI